MTFDELSEMSILLAVNKHRSLNR